MKQTKFFTSLMAMLFMLLPVSMMAEWSYVSNGNVLSAYGEGSYTAQNPLSITLNAPADLQFNGNYKPATLSNTDAWTAAGLTVPTILYDGKTNAPSMLGTYTASISAGDATAEVVYTIKTVIDYQSFSITASPRVITLTLTTPVPTKWDLITPPNPVYGGIPMRTAPYLMVKPIFR